MTRGDKYEIKPIDHAILMTSHTEQRPARILPVIILSQFAGTSLWFAGNAVLDDLTRAWLLAPAALGYITSAVQVGFICGTLVFAFLALADRLSPRKVFLGCAVPARLPTSRCWRRRNNWPRCSPAVLRPAFSWPAFIRSA